MDDGQPLPDGDVAAEAWLGEADARSAGVARLAAVAFAQRHGMTTAAAREVDVAIARVMRQLSAASFTLDAATDGEWLAVLLRTDGGAERLRSEQDDVASALRPLCDRLEIDVAPGRGAYVLMEFGMPDGQRATPERAAAVLARERGA